MLRFNEFYAHLDTYLLELYGLLPDDMGGDLEKANSLAEKLSSEDSYYGAKAQEALAPDPYFSRATGIPSPILFLPPDQMCHHHSSFFGPF